jgi:iron complex transport system substrate-binding protein
LLTLLKHTFYACLYCACLSLQAEPVRVISQTLGADEMVLALLPPQQIAGLSMLSVKPEYSHITRQVKALNLPIIQGIEALIATPADMVIVAAYNRAEMLSLLEKSGLKTVRFNHFRYVKDIMAQIQQLGQVLNQADKARVLVQQMQTKIEQAQARIPAKKPAPRVLFLNPWGYTAGTDTLLNDLLGLAGGINIAAEKGLSGHVKLQTESVLAWQPDIIISEAAVGEFASAKARLLKHPAIQYTPAAKNQRIYILDQRDLMSVSQHCVDVLPDLQAALFIDQAKSLRTNTTHPNLTNP